jgi:TonB family protein
MISASVEVERWKAGRWWFSIGMVFAVQLGLILWFGNRATARPRPPAAAPTFSLSRNYPNELLRLHDPTLFALPHRQGFAGLAWLKMPQMDFGSFDWSERTNWLALAPTQLGAVFARFIETNHFDLWQPADPEPDLGVPEMVSAVIPAEPSRLRLEGELVGRKLITPVQLPSWPSTEVLTNSVVQVFLDGEGKPASVRLLLPGSGKAEVDQEAYKIARAARFEPVTKGGPGRIANPMANLNWGQMIFEWGTLPAAATNAPNATP